MRPNGQFIHWWKCTCRLYVGSQNVYWSIKLQYVVSTVYSSRSSWVKVCSGEAIVMLMYHRTHLLILILLNTCMRHLISVSFYCFFSVLIIDCSVYSVQPCSHLWTIEFSVATCICRMRNPVIYQSIIHSSCSILVEVRWFTNWLELPRSHLCWHSLMARNHVH